MTVFKNLLLPSLTVLAACGAVSGHSWVEQVRKIDLTGQFTGEVGYPMHFVNRTPPNVFNDHLAQNQILDTKSNPAVCKSISGAYADGVSRLTASPGDYVALIYQENGHVTQPWITERPYRDGLVTVYGTMEHEDDDGINDVLNAWTADGKGGNGKGKLLATHYYDDGQCYQNGAGYIFEERSKKYGLAELYCQSDFQLPSDLPESGTYTVMWVWDWPLITSNTTNTTEIYTSCIEITLEPKSSNSSSVQAMKFATDIPVASAGISSQLLDAYEATGLGVGTFAPAAPTSTPAQSDSTATADVSTITSTANATSTSTKHHHSGIKTITVTAAAETTTQWKTVTVGAGSTLQSPGVSSQSTSASTPAQVTASSSSAAVVATSSPVASVLNGPISVSKFLKARATGHARR
ncbi:hypothetical protein GGR53DRAFT_533232 [Hypoxylon sp. FL1150]|nr:hypothetical protein GGR53DRAFT_533232 [Hypoxylon sp. FL1150]